MSSTAISNTHESILSSVLTYLLGVVLLSHVLGVYPGASWKLMCEPIPKRTGSVSSDAIRSVLGVYLEASCELTWELIVKQTGIVLLSEIRSAFENVLGIILKRIL